MAERAAARVLTPVALVRVLRPHQWVKNVFEATPLVIDKHLIDTTYDDNAAI